MRDYHGSDRLANYRMKEKAVVEQFERRMKRQFSTTSILLDQRASKHTLKRPDISIRMDAYSIFIEIDEFAHEGYSHLEEYARAYELEKAQPDKRPILIIRLNVDDFVSSVDGVETYFPSPWANESSVLNRVVNKPEWNKRLHRLFNVLMMYKNQTLSVTPGVATTTIYLFYNDYSASELCIKEGLDHLRSVLSVEDIELCETVASELLAKEGFGAREDVLRAQAIKQMKDAAKKCLTAVSNLSKSKFRVAETKAFTPPNKKGLPTRKVKKVKSTPGDTRAKTQSMINKYLQRTAACEFVIEGIKEPIEHTEQREEESMDITEECDDQDASRDAFASSETICLSDDEYEAEVEEPFKRRKIGDIVTSGFVCTKPVNYEDPEVLAAARAEAKARRFA